MGLDHTDLKSLIRTIPDFPKPGIQFRDISTLLSDASGLKTATQRLAAHLPEGVSAIAGIEARGFVFGATVAAEAGLGFYPVRKAGKLPGDTISVGYALEYGSDRLEVHAGAIPSGARVVIIDDLIATGGTALAASTLLDRAGAEVVQALFVVDLPDLGGADRLRARGIPVETLVEFEGD